MTKLPDGEKRGRGRPSEDTAALTVRLPQKMLDAIEEARALTRPVQTRTEVIREALDKWLTDKGLME